MTNNARRNRRNKELKRIERTTVATDQNSQIVTSDVKDKLTFITFILFDGHFSDIEILQDILNGLDSRIGDPVHFLFGILAPTFVFLR